MVVTDYERAVRWATDWSQRWFLDAAGRDRLRVGEIDAGWATHVEGFGLLFRHALRHVGATENLTTRHSLTATLKRAGLDRAMRAVGLRLTVRGSADDVARAPVVAMVEIPTPSMTDGVVAVAGRSDLRAPIAVADPRAARRLRDRGADVVPLTVPLRLERSILRRSAAAAAASWQRIRRDPPELRLDGEDLTAGALDALGPLVERSIPWLGPEDAAVRRILAAAEPRAVLLASDQHRIGRLTVHVAAERGIRTVVLQHGLPQGRVGLVPVVADRVATWSAGAARWFAAQGTPADRLIVTGNPRFDELRDVRDRRGTGPGHSELLLALSPTDTALNRRVVEQALEALGRLDGTTMTIKLHPGQSEWHWLDAMIDGHHDRVRIARHEPLYPLLAAAGVTALHRSTVAVESLAAGTPVVVIGAAEPNARNDLAGVDLPVAETPDDLARLVEETTADPAGYFSERAEGLHDALGPLDGDAGGRVARLLLNG